MGNILKSLNLGLCWGQCNLDPHSLGKEKKRKNLPPAQAVFKRRSVEPQKPVLSRSALSCERKGDRVSSIAREGTATGVAEMVLLSSCLHPLWPIRPVLKAMGFPSPRGNFSAGQFRVSSSQFRAGWEDSCFSDYSLTLEKQKFGKTSGFRRGWERFASPSRLAAAPCARGHECHMPPHTSRTGPITARHTCSAFNHS